MKKLYYRGQPFDFEIAELMGKTFFVLYKNGEVVQYVKEDEVDIRSRVSMILDDYYQTREPSVRTDLLR